MNTTINPAKVKSQLRRELDAVNSFQRNIDNALKMVRKITIGDDVDSLTKNIKYNVQMQNLYLERAEAVLEALGMVEEEGTLDIPHLQALIEKL